MTNTPDGHAPAPSAVQAYDPTILTEWQQGIMIEHFIPRNVCENLAQVFAQLHPSGMWVVPPWLFVLMLKARTPAQLQSLREAAQQRQLSDEHITREAALKHADAIQIALDHPEAKDAK